MGQPQPKDPFLEPPSSTNDQADQWLTSYTTYLVTFTTRQGTTANTTIFASSAAEAVGIVNTDKPTQMLFGPLTNVTAVVSASTGDT